ncbi:MAG: hypothetical protein AABW52_03315 [Nanoarchaeota archaeon]
MEISELVNSYIQEIRIMYMHLVPLADDTDDDYASLTLIIPNKLIKEYKRLKPKRFKPEKFWKDTGLQKRLREIKILDPRTVNCPGEGKVTAGIIESHLEWKIQASIKPYRDDQSEMHVMEDPKKYRRQTYWQGLSD